MLELQKVKSFPEEIFSYVSERRDKHRIPCTSSDNQTARILNQEKDGCILYTWDDVSDVSEGAMVTHFGLYNPTTQKHQVIHMYNQRVYVVSCSINQERTLMAFTTMSREGSLMTSTDKRTGKEKYSAYLAELKAQSPRVFSLNLERQTFLKVQFLYEDKPVEKETYMLVMLHRESIGLYKIPLARVATGMVMRGQPKTEQVAKKFSWCQWDSQNQQLFYILSRRDGNNVKQHLLSCVQFYNSAAHDHVLDVPLNFPIPSKSSGRCYYADIPLHNGIPDTSINICVLTQNSGTFCVCYQQHVLTSDRRPKSSPLPRTSPLQRTSPSQHSSHFQASPTGSDGDSTDINYYICMVHHAKTLHGCVSSIPPNIVRKAVLHFSWLGDTVLVMLPGYFVHLLNVSMEFEPSNHIFLHSKTFGDSFSKQLQVKEDSAADRGSHDQQTDQSASSIAVASWETDMSLPVMSLMAEHLVFSSNSPLVTLGKELSGSYILERTTGAMYRIHLNMASLIHTFTHCYMPMTRSALLHYVILRHRDFILLKQLFLVLCNDIPSPEVPNLMTEFLIAMTYAGMRRQIDREVLRLLPFTNTEPFRGQIDKTCDGDRLARVSYSAIHSVNIGTKSAKERQQRKGIVGDDWLDMLRRHLRWMQLSKSRRFSLETVKQTYTQMRAKEEKHLQTKEEENFLSELRIQKSKPRRERSDTVGNYGNKTEGILGTAPPFLQGSSVTEASETLMSLTKEVLAKHMLTYLHKDGKVKANAVAKEYVSCQQTQSRLLCHLLWTLRGQHLQDPESTTPRSLLEKSSLDEYELFQLFERYALATGELMFPVPSGFRTYFTSIAFRCLNVRLFMQYVNHGVIQLTGEFMAHLLSDLPDTKENVRLKQYLITKLPQASAVECYKIWGHSSCQSYLAHQQVAEILDNGMRARAESTQSESNRRSTIFKEKTSDDIENVTFQPLAAFLKHIDKKESKRSRHDRGSPLDFIALEEVALYHTTHETNYDMGTVNF
ncbi:protein pigeon-like isoform X2 [Mercenaria mercenaria]|uniref:protein pigeon-like isoform X2 n=1 Tax=Mercenaria mercenaria TaxID=6596 RepID=UPI00234F7A27|nr:protein pigeon-like isoform X2 [Mercenaria mercenaria]